MMGQDSVRLLKVAIVDDHEVVRMGLKNMIERQPDMTISAECSSGSQALAEIPNHADVVVLDVRLPDMNGLEVCRQLCQQDSDLHVIILTSFGNDDMVLDAIEAGASGYLLKEARGHTVLEGIRTVAQGGSLFSPQVTGALMDRLRHASPTHDVIDTLSPQELKILELVAQGKTNKEIGQSLFLSEKTVKHYVSNVLNKLGYTRRSEAAAHYARHQASKEGPSDGYPI